MALDTTPYEFHDHPRAAMRFVVLAALVVLLFALAAASPGRAAAYRSIPGVSEPCASAACVAPTQIIRPGDARRMKRELADHALLVDIRAAAEMPAGLALGSDVRVPFVEAPGIEGAPLQFRADFGEKVDDALRASRMRHDDAVILISPLLDRGVQAALLLQERGYSRILVVDH